MQLAKNRQFPPMFGRSVRRANDGMILMVLVTMFFVVAFDLNAIANIGSAVALSIFAMVTIAHLRIRRETGASLRVLLVALVTTLGTLAVFTSTTRIEDKASLTAVAARPGCPSRWRTDKASSRRAGSLPPSLGCDPRGR